MRRRRLGRLDLIEACKRRSRHLEHAMRYSKFGENRFSVKLHLTATRIPTNCAFYNLRHAIYFSSALYTTLELQSSRSPAFNGFSSSAALPSTIFLSPVQFIAFRRSVRIGWEWWKLE
jgi:hypothetical protein